MQVYLNEAKGLNDELVSVIPENKHEAAIDWYEEQLDRVKEASLHAKAHLEDRSEESSSGLSSVKSGKTSSKKSVNSQASEIQTKIASAEIKAKQQALQEQ